MRFELRPSTMRKALALTAVAAFALAGCSKASGSGSASNGGGSGNSTGSSSKGDIVIGMPVALSGEFVYFDQPWLNGARLAVQAINKKGGVLGRQLRIVTANTFSSIPSATTAAQKVISEGAQFILPTIDYDFGAAAARVASKANLITIGFAGNTRWGVQGLGPLVFNLDQAAPTEAADDVLFTKHQKWTHPYVLKDTALSYTSQLCDSYSSEWKSATNTAVVGEDTFANSDSSIASQITRIKNASPKPDVIVLCSFPPGGVSAIKQIRAAGITTPILGNVTFSNLSWVSAVPGNNLSMYADGGGAPPNDPNALRKSVYTAYQSQFGTIKDSAGPLAGYSAVQALALAISRAKSTDTNAVLAQLNKFKNEELAVGPVTWTASCHIPVGLPYTYDEITKSEIKFSWLAPITKPKEAC